MNLFLWPSFIASTQCGLRRIWPITSFYPVWEVIIKSTTYAVVKKLLLCHDSQAAVIQKLTPIHAEKKKRL